MGMFKSLVGGLDEQGRGVRAYEALARDARARVAENPDRAAGLFLISVGAQRFADRYDDQPLTVEVASEELKAFTDHAERLDSAFESGTDQDRVAALNAIAARFVEDWNA